MTDDLTTRYDGVLERTADGGIIRFERHLAFDVHDVWDAITTPERLADWWLPFDADITVDLREGGEMVFAGTADGEAVRMTCTILRIEPPRVFEHTHPAPGSSMRWELEAADTGCILRLSHIVPDVQEAIDNCYLVGLFTSLARLEPCLAGRPTAWDWDAFAVARAHYASLGLASPADAS
ncbi:MAG: SRPBCC family protein [Ilumatobacteraceae bacterium]